MTVRGLSGPLRSTRGVCGAPGRRFGWRAQTDFGSVLAALREGRTLPFAHDPDYTSPIIAQEREACMC